MIKTLDPKKTLVGSFKIPSDFISANFWARARASAEVMAFSSEDMCFECGFQLHAPRLNALNAASHDEGASGKVDGNCCAPVV